MADILATIRNNVRRLRTGNHNDDTDFPRSRAEHRATRDEIRRTNARSRGELGAGDTSNAARERFLSGSAQPEAQGVNRAVRSSIEANVASRTPIVPRPGDRQMAETRTQVASTRVADQRRASPPVIIGDDNRAVAVPASQRAMLRDVVATNPAAFGSFDDYFDALIGLDRNGDADSVSLRDTEVWRAQYDADREMRDGGEEPARRRQTLRRADGSSQDQDEEGRPLRMRGSTDGYLAPGSAAPVKGREPLNAADVSFDPNRTPEGYRAPDVPATQPAARGPFDAAQALRQARGRARRHIAEAQERGGSSRGALPMVRIPSQLIARLDAAHAAARGTNAEVERRHQRGVAPTQ